jgi:hypothetical protein
MAAGSGGGKSVDVQKEEDRLQAIVLAGACMCMHVCVRFVVGLVWFGLGWIVWGGRLTVHLCVYIHIHTLGKPINQSILPPPPP